MTRWLDLDFAALDSYSGARDVSSDQPLGRAGVGGTSRGSGGARRRPRRRRPRHGVGHLPPAARRRRASGRRQSRGDATSRAARRLTPLLAESSVSLADRHVLFARAESRSEDRARSRPARAARRTCFSVGKLQAGYSYMLPAVKRMACGHWRRRLGWESSPGDLEYGLRQPHSARLWRLSDLSTERDGDGRDAPGDDIIARAWFVTAAWPSSSSSTPSSRI